MLVRLVAAWFLLTLGAAVASAMVHPQAMELICSGGSVKAVPVGGGDVAGVDAHTLDCPLCLPATAPPPRALALPPFQPLAHGSHWVAAAPAAALIGAPLPPRGPPRFV